MKLQANYIITCFTSHLLKCSSRHSLQNLWPHLVRTGSLSGKWHIKHCKSSSTAFTKSSAWPEGSRVFLPPSVILRGTIVVISRWCMPVTECHATLPNLTRACSCCLICFEKGCLTTGHFRISLNLFFKASLSAHPFIWKWDFIHMQIELIFIWMADGEA